MAKFRLYSTTGIFGHRYKDYYVVRDIVNDNNSSKKIYYVVNSSNDKMSDNIYYNYWDAEWEIDKLAASPDLIELLKSLYSEETSTLNQFFLELMQKNDDHTITMEERTLLDWVTKIRKRKYDDKPF